MFGHFCSNTARVSTSHFHVFFVCCYFTRFDNHQYGTTTVRPQTGKEAKLLRTRTKTPFLLHDVDALPLRPPQGVSRGVHYHRLGCFFRLCSPWKASSASLKSVATVGRTFVFSEKAERRLRSWMADLNSIGWWIF